MSMGWRAVSIDAYETPEQSLEWLSMRVGWRAAPLKILKVPEESPEWLPFSTEWRMSPSYSTSAYSNRMLIDYWSICWTQPLLPVFHPCVHLPAASVWFFAQFSGSRLQYFDPSLCFQKPMLDPCHSSKTMFPAISTPAGCSISLNLVTLSSLQ